MATRIITESKSNGRIYTPLFIVNNVLDLSGYVEEKILKKHIIDNSCGDGAFLVEIVKRYCEEFFKHSSDKNVIKQELEHFIHGIEKDEIECQKCIENISAVAYSFGVEGVNWDINCANTLAVDKYNGKMDFVVGNPPYIRVHNLGDSFENVKKFEFSQSGMTDLYIVFYEIGLKMLNDSGVLGYIAPSSYFNSVAGSYMRNYLVQNNLLSKIVDLKHFQAFNATTYTAITIIDKSKDNNLVDYYQFDEKNLIPYYVDTLSCDDYYLAGSYYFAKKEELRTLRKILFNVGVSDISVKNGYATLCDPVFINKFDFESKHIIPVIKASTATKKQIFYPYDTQGKLISEDELKLDINMYDYLCSNKEILCDRSIDKKASGYWYAFGRTQAINDTYKNKMTINALVRDKSDLKMIDCPSGVGVYSGLYIISPTITYQAIRQALSSDEFVSYISLLGKYKSGGYYTFSSKDIKVYLNYIFAYEGGLINE